MARRTSYSKFNGKCSPLNEPTIGLQRLEERSSGQFKVLAANRRKIIAQCRPANDMSLVRKRSAWRDHSPCAHVRTCFPRVNHKSCPSTIDFGHERVSNPEMSHFLQNQGNRGPIRRMGSPSKARTNQRITRRRTKVRRTCLRALRRQGRNPAD